MTSPPHHPHRTSTASAQTEPVILFTAFEPSGDDHAAGVIAQLRKRAPQIRIFAYGGPKMFAAGATIIETTTEHAVMLAGAAGQALAHRRRVKRIRTWLGEHPVIAHVPVDSPAANWAICQAVRDCQPAARILHLVAPQLWAWAPGRIHKLRRLTDHVMCLLSFEPQWFGTRGVEATFVGHPLFDRAPRQGHGQLVGLPNSTSLRLALLPGSRPGEIRRNWPTMIQAVARLRQRHPELVAVAALRDDKAVDLLPGRGRTLPPGVVIRPGQTDAVLDWADVVLVVSGTATLQVAAHRKPMVTMFNASRLSWELLGRWLIKTRTFTLPNLIGEWQGLGRVTPEFVPHFGNVRVIADALELLLTDAGAREAQTRLLDEVIAPFQSHICANEAATLILQQTAQA